MSAVYRSAASAVSLFLIIENPTEASQYHIIIQITEPKEAKRPNEEWTSSHLESEKDETTSMLKARVNIGHDLSSNATGHWNNDP